MRCVRSQEPEILESMTCPWEPGTAGWQAWHLLNAPKSPLNLEDLYNTVSSKCSIEWDETMLQSHLDGYKYASVYVRRTLQINIEIIKRAIQRKRSAK